MVGFCLFISDLLGQLEIRYNLFVRCLFQASNRKEVLDKQSNGPAGPIRN